MYSKITTIEVVNFMSFKYGKVTFDEKGIINIKGYNDSGKSAFLRALAVCFTNMYSTKQVKFIHHGEDYFRIIVTFDDGVKIIRDKYVNGQSLYEMYKHDVLLFTTKQGTKLSKVDDVPDIIKDYLGLCVIDNGCLNYQQRDDKLWLVQTGGSENYYSLNEILKTEEISRANALINSDKNKLSSEITEIEADLQESQILLNNCKDISEDFLMALTEKESSVQQLCSQYTDISKAGETLEQLSSLKEIPEVEPVNCERLTSISEIEATISEMRNMSPIPEILCLETRKLSALSKLNSMVLEYSKASRSQIPEISGLDSGALVLLHKIMSLIEELESVAKSIQNCDKEAKGVQEEILQIVAEAEARGVTYIKCSNCGTFLEVEK